MNKNKLIILLLFQVTTLLSQSQDPCFSSSIPLHPQTSEPIPIEIAAFNELVKITSFHDSISYSFEDKTTEYFFQDQPLIDWTYPDYPILMKEYILSQNKNKLLISYATVNERYNLNRPEEEISYLLAYIPIEDNKWKIIDYRNDFGQKNIQCYYLNELLKDGAEKMYRCDGSLIYERNYHLIDSNYVTESQQLIPEPKMYIDQKFFHNKYSENCGVWRYYNENGLIKKEEEYEECKRQ